MNELSLFSGAGGGLLATKHFLKWRTIGYVEQNHYCQNIIAQRAKEGLLDSAPLWGDINEFIESGAVDQYEGVTDVVTGGFPCQPFSVAGRRKGKDDSRNCWPQCIEVIRRVKPRFFFGENVPGLLNSGYFPEILRSLAQAGYAARWKVLGVDDCGGNHRRKRLWLLAYSPDKRSKERYAERSQQTGEGEADNALSRSKDVAHSVSDSEGSAYGSKVWRGFERWEDEDIKEWYEVGGNPTNFSGQWAIEPSVGRVAHGVASRVDRLKALGNGQTPIVAATAWRMLGGQIK